jgi:hypothetical protein
LVRFAVSTAAEVQVSVPVPAPPPAHATPPAGVGHVTADVAFWRPAGRLTVITTTPFVFTPVVEVVIVYVMVWPGFTEPPLAGDCASEIVVVGRAASDLFH